MAITKKKNNKINNIQNDLLASKYRPGPNKDFPIDKKYGFEIIKKDGDCIEIRKDGYNYNALQSNISKFSFGIKNMTYESRLEFINNNSFLNTKLRAVSITKAYYGPLINVLNIDTGKMCICRNVSSPDVEQLLKDTRHKEDYLTRVKNKLGDFYDYSKTVCDSRHGKAIVTCPIHGDFSITIANTVRAGCGCPKCSVLGFSKSNFINRCINKKLTAKLYFIKCYNEYETFYKIGITSKDISYRLNQIPYNTEVVLAVNDEPDLIYDLEKKLHRKHFKNNYTPTISFGGMTECFSFESEYDVIESILLEQKLINKTNTYHND